MTRPHRCCTIGLLGAALAALLVAAPPAAVGQTAGTCAYVAETGHWVCDEFRAFYDSSGGADFLGNPLTRQYTDPKTGLQVQVFEGGRLELHPDLLEGDRVQLSRVIDDMGYSFPEAEAGPVSPLCRGLQSYFPAARHTVSYAFLRYFRTHGGLEMFGYPRSESFVEGGRFVQYFQSVRMEWHPELHSGPGVRLGDIGHAYLDKFPVDTRYTAPEPPGVDPGSEQTNGGAVVLRMRVDASVRDIATGAGGAQIIYAYVMDQEGRPVEGAQVSVAVQGEQAALPFECGETDVNGFSTCILAVPTLSPGQRVNLTVTAVYGDRRSQTPTSYVVWW